MKAKLIGSAPTKEQLIDLIKKRLYWSEVSLNDDGSVSSAKGLVSGFIWRQFKNRFRLEML